jgi:hypothetical protein
VAVGLVGPNQVEARQVGATGVIAGVLDDVERKGLTLERAVGEPGDERMVEDGLVGVLDSPTRAPP